MPSAMKSESKCLKSSPKPQHFSLGSIYYHSSVAKNVGRVRTTQSMDREISDDIKCYEGTALSPTIHFPKRKYLLQPGKRHFSYSESRIGVCSNSIQTPKSARRYSEAYDLHTVSQTRLTGMFGFSEKRAYTRQHPETDININVVQSFRPRALSTSLTQRRDRTINDYEYAKKISDVRSKKRAVSLPRFIRESSTSNYDVRYALPTNEVSFEACSVGNGINIFNTKNDISSLVLEPGEKFVPTDVKVVLLPSGTKAVTYTKFSQKGYGDQQMANAEIEKIVQRTECLQDSMHTLEYFVKRNRSLFPKDIIIYQKIIFYLLSEGELKKMGEMPNAEIYGVRIREKLVAPTGSDVADILKKYYSKYNEVDVEYQEKSKIVRELDKESGIEKSMEAETELENRHRSKASQQFSFKRRQLSIDDTLLTDTADITAKCKPQFTSLLKSKKAIKGQNIRFTGTVFGDPYPKVTWFHGSKILNENVSERYSITNNYGMCNLKISNVYECDAGVYTVKASNSFGEVLSTASLTVEDPILSGKRRQVHENLDDKSIYFKQRILSNTINDIATISLWNQSHFVFNNNSSPKGHKPEFVVQPPLEISVQEGDPLTLRCVVDGDPMPVVTWFKGARELTYSERHRVLAEKNGCFVMQIMSAVQTDPGEYTVIASNECGQVLCEVFVNVVPRPKEGIDNEWTKPELAGYDYDLVQRTVDSKMSPIFIKKLPREKELMVGETVILDCHIHEAKTRKFIVGVDIIAKGEKELPSAKYTKNQKIEEQ